MIWSYCIIFVFSCDYGVVIVFVLLLSDGSFFGGVLRFKSGVDGIGGEKELKVELGLELEMQIDIDLEQDGVGWGT